MAYLCDDEMSTTQRSLSSANVAILVDSLIIKGMSKSSSRQSTALPPGAQTERSAVFRVPQLRRFDSAKVPRIGVCDYVERLKKFGHFDSALVVGLIYLDRLLAADSNFAVTPHNIHRLLIVCTTVAEKYHNDSFYGNTYYASVGGLQVEELNRLEVIMLYSLMWRLDASEEEYNEKLRELNAGFAAASRSSKEDEWIVLSEARGEKRSLEDADSESSIQASTMSGSVISVSDSDEIMDSSSEDS